MSDYKQATIQEVINTVKYFKENPEALVNTGIWNELHWDRFIFTQWFHKCLNDKINTKGQVKGWRQGWRKMDDSYTRALQWDRRVIESYLFQRIRNTGSHNILHTPELKQKYPHINTQKRDYA